MSILTQCNYCHLKDAKAEAKKNGLKVTVIYNDGFHEVYIHKKGEKPNRKECGLFLKEIPNSCCC